MTNDIPDTEVQDKESAIDIAYGNYGRAVLERNDMMRSLADCSADDEPGHGKVIRMIRLNAEYRAARSLADEAYKTWSEML